MWWDINGDGEHDAMDDAVILALLDEDEKEEQKQTSYTPSQKSKTGCGSIIFGIILFILVVKAFS